ncbi:hypothetical protein B0H14DRAFT_3486616 [Mycena olivaceomarginata]|nr:hypothetical protein B0H14DRAFT_3486616 [Mycena olivaceomarginata]
MEMHRLFVSWSSPRGFVPEVHMRAREMTGEEGMEICATNIPQTSRARCSLGRIVFTHDVPLAPSFPLPYLSYPASGHVRYMTASDGFPVRCCALLGSSLWRVGGRASLMMYMRDAVSVGGHAPRHLPNTPTRGPRLGDMTGNGREHIFSSFISCPASARDFFRQGARSASLVVLRDGVLLVPAPLRSSSYPRSAYAGDEGRREDGDAVVIHACGFLDPHPCAALLPVVAEDTSVPSHILLPPFALRNSRTKHTGGRGEGKWRAHWAVLRFRE